MKLKTLAISIGLAFVAQVSSACGFYEIAGADNNGWKNDDCDIRVIARETGVRLVYNAKKDFYHIEVNNGINIFSVDVIEKYLKDAGEYMGTVHNKAISVYLNSPGGSAWQGIRLNKLFQGRRNDQPWAVSARVIKGQVCASACAVAFTGALYRSISHTGLLKFHAPYTTSDLGVKRCNTDPTSDINAALLTAYKKTLGVDKGNRLFKETNKCKPNANLVTYNQHNSKWFQN